jgi:hypothetical protein
VAREEAVGRAHQVTADHVGDQVVHQGGGHEQQHDRADQLDRAVQALDEHRDAEQPLGAARRRDVSHGGAPASP